MKKLFTVFAIAFAVYACTPKAAPVKTPGTDTVTVTAADEIPPPPPPPSGSSIVKEGQTVYNSKCGKCHELKDTKAFTKTEWDGILKDMAPKAKLTMAETAYVNAFVKANAKDTQP